MLSGALSVFFLAGLVALVGCAPTPAPAPSPAPAPVPVPPVLKDSPSNQVTVDDDEYLSQEERERVVAGIILQIARDFDAGFISQDDLMGRSALRQDDVARKGRKETELSIDKEPPQAAPQAT